MNRSFIVLSLALLQVGSATVSAQQNNPLIQSGLLITEAAQLSDSGANKKAIAIYKKIDYNDTNYVRALYGISLCYYADSQYTESAHYCEKALALAPDSDPLRIPDLCNQYANAIDAAGNSERALRIYDSALSKYPAVSLLRQNKGNVLTKLHRYQEAEALYKEALLIDPYAYSVHYKLAIIALYQGKLIPGFLGLLGYLMIYPEGKYAGSAISILSAISKNEDEVQKYVNERKESPGEHYQQLEQILQSKIALDVNYKPIIQLDDKISRQIQVIFEKMEYQESDSDFWMQYYIPYFKSVYTSNQFEYFINHIFAGVNLPVIKDFNKKHKKEKETLTMQAAEYFNRIRSSRELMYAKRKADTLWSYSEGALIGHGIYKEKEDKLSGLWEFTYAQGNVKSRGQYDEHGKKTGPFTYYYFDGKVKGKEYYREGKQEEEETYYYSNGAISSHSWYKNNLPDGESRSYYWSGALRSITPYRAGKEDGTKIGFYSTGDTSYLENYSAGELNGIAKSWFENRTKELDCLYGKGKLDGPYRKYHSNGQLFIAGEYKAGKQEGLWKSYHENGQLKVAQTFVNDKQEGEYKEYYDNGKLHLSYVFKKGKVDGEVRYYDDDEKLYAVYRMDNDLITKTQFFDKTGKQISESNRRQKDIDILVFLPEGSKRQEVYYDEKGNISGTESFFFPSGTVYETDEYKEGEEQGPSIVYYTNKQKKSETMYVDGKMDGYHRSFYVDGTVQEEGWYKAGIAQGYWLSYNDLGILTDSVYYIDGELNGCKSSYLPNGQKEFELKYKSGWLTQWKQYDSSGHQLTDLTFTKGAGKASIAYPGGKLYMTATYLNNKLEGPRTFYYFDGKPLAWEYYKRGLEDSSYKSYYYSGKLHIEGQYRNGEKTGIWKGYFPSGKISSSEEYVNGKQTGKELSYLENGQVERETVYKDGEKDGPTKKTDPDGTLLYQLTYKAGKPVSYTYLDKNNKLLPEIPIEKGNARIKTYFPNGNVSAEFAFQDGLFTGANKQYYSNGKPRGLGQMEEGNWEGSYITYYANGQMKGQYFNFHDNLHGPYKEFNEKGVLTEEGGYYLGAPHGLLRKYDDAGKLMETYLYYYGKPISIKNEQRP